MGWAGLEGMEGKAGLKVLEGKAGLGETVELAGELLEVEVSY